MRLMRLILLGGLSWAACSARAPALHHNPVVQVRVLGLSRLTQEEHTANGSGFFANANGDIVTNRHVVIQAGLQTRQIVVTVDGEWMYPATLVHADKETDLAVIRIRADHETLLPILRLGETASLGDAVRLSGYPGGGRFREERGRVMRIGARLECAIPVAVGNSGGPLLSEQGLVVGVVCAIRKRTFGGAVSADFCLVVPVETLRRQLAKWRVAHR